MKSSAHPMWVVVIAALLGIYGCAQGPGNPTSLEGKIQRLEEEMRAVHAAREQLRQKLLAAEEQQAQLHRQLQQWQAQAAAERDALQAELRQRTAERDAVTAHYDKFRRDLKELLLQAEATLPGTASPSLAPAPQTISRQQDRSLPHLHHLPESGQSN